MRHPVSYKVWNYCGFSLKPVRNNEVAEEDKFPPESDPVWADWSRGLLEYLSEPRSWKELERWRRGRNQSKMLLRNCLAWLHNQGMVTLIEGASGRLYWARLPG